MQKECLKFLLIKILVIIMIYKLKVIHYYLLMYLKILKICLKEYELDPGHFLLSAPGLAWQACLKETGIKLELLTVNDMLLMIEKGI